MDLQPRILVVDDMPRNVRLLVDRLSADGYTTVEAADGVAALDSLQNGNIDLVLLDLVMPGMDGYQVLEAMQQDDALRRIPVIVVTAIDQVDSVVRCLELGADDYISKPINATVLRARVSASLEKKRWRDREVEYLSQIEGAKVELEQTVADRTADLEKALHELATLKNRLAAENQYLKQEIKSEFDFEEINTRSDEYNRVLEAVDLVAATDSTVLILGETGTGKELLARGIHSSGSRKDKSLVKVNCAAIPVHLVESELFGHERGAFTGASGRKIGRFELADGGTIFLDEIGELPFELQSKLLRVLQEGEIERIGGTRTLRVDVRVIAATNRNLEAMVQSGDFRQDLFYRLNVFPIICPPLRKRKEDIPLLVEHFVYKYGTKTGHHHIEVENDALELLSSYDWPGNIRELENIVQRALITSTGSTLDVGDWFVQLSGRREEPSRLDDQLTGFATLNEVDRRHIVSVLESSNWIVRGDSGAAAILGLKPTTLEARMKKLGIVRP